MRWHVASEPTFSQCCKGLLRLAGRRAYASSNRAATHAGKLLSVSRLGTCFIVSATPSADVAIAGTGAATAAATAAATLLPLLLVCT